MGVDIKKWKDFPSTFRSLKKETMETKNNKSWSYLVNITEETIFPVFIDRFDGILSPARVHVCDGYYQDKTFSMLFERGSKVTNLIYSIQIRKSFIF